MSAWRVGLASTLVLLLWITNATLTFAQVAPMEDPNRPEDEPYHLLFISSPMNMAPRHLELFKACFREFEHLTGRPAVMHLETIGIHVARNQGMKVLFDQGTQDEALAQIRSRYSGRIDFVVMRGPVINCLQGQELFPGVPTVLPMVNTHDFDLLETLPANTYLFRIHSSPLPAAQTALEVYPDTRQLIIVSGTSYIARLLRNQAQQEIGERIHNIPVEYWTGLTMGELERRAAHLTDGQLILFLLMKKDANGVLYDEDEVMEVFSRTAHVPVFVNVDSFLGHGALGGYVNSAGNHGRRAARLLAHLARGESSETIIDVYDYGEKQFDWYQMQRWGLRTSQLPADARILHQPESLLARHPWIVPAVCTCMVLLMLITVSALLYTLLRGRFLRRMKQYHLRLKALTSKLTLAEERLKNNVATQLHDTICQSIAISKARVTALERESGDTKASNTLAEIRMDLDQALLEARDMTLQLSYPILNVLGLEKAVDKWLTEEVYEKHGIKTHFVVEGTSELALEEDTRAVLFRGFRELVTNTVKHSRAQNLTVTIIHSETDITLTVEDDGIGYDYQGDSTDISGFGLISLQESLETFGGRLAIQSRSGSGYRASINISHSKTSKPVIPLLSVRNVKRVFASNLE